MKVSSAGTDTVTFKYDPFGRRIEKSVATTEDGLPTTYKYTYVYDNEDIILEVLERTQDGVTTTTTTSYVHGPGADEPLSFTREGQAYYYHADGLGSITAVTDANEAVVNRYAYDTFGRIQESETVRNAYAFTGREYDSETGLYYLRARYYDPEAGRFVSKDPIGFAGGDVNLYNYTSGNPVNWVDPWGLFELPNNPGGLPPNWTSDTSHRDPIGQRFRDPSGRPLDWHPGQTGEPGWRGRDHWHDSNNFGKKHLPPGTNIPDPAPLPKPPVPWWRRIPMRIPGPFPIIIDPCIINPSAPYCRKSCGV